MIVERLKLLLHVFLKSDESHKSFPNCNLSFMAKRVVSKPDIVVCCSGVVILLGDKGVGFSSLVTFVGVLGE